jgi:hypothetical protein
MSADWVPTEINLTKRLTKMVHRIERIMESNQSVHLNLGTKFGVLTKLIERGNFYSDAGSVIKQLMSGRKIPSKNTSAVSAAENTGYKVVKWDELKKSISEIICHGDLSVVIPEKVHGEMDCEHNLHIEEETRLKAKEKLRYLQMRNGQPVVSGRWRKEAYPPRQYEFLNNYAVTTTISEEEGDILKEQLITPLNGFLGQAYNYDDHGLTEVILQYLGFCRNKTCYYHCCYHPISTTNHRSWYHVYLLMLSAANDCTQVSILWATQN